MSDLWSEKIIAVVHLSILSTKRRLLSETLTSLTPICRFKDKEALKLVRLHPSRILSLSHVALSERLNTIGLDIVELASVYGKH